MKYHIAIVMPPVDNGFYLDAKSAGRAHGAFEGQALVRCISRIFLLSGEKEDIYIIDLSMGGFGAIRTSLFYLKQFCRMFGLSSALIVNDIEI